MRKFAWISLSLIPLLWAAVARADQPPSFEGEDSRQILQEMATLTPDDTVARLVNSHPGKYFLYVESLWNQGKKDDAVMWFYVAKLRYRFHLLAHPDLDPAGDPATYAGISHDFGLPVVNHAAVDTKVWAQQIAAALDWDAAHDNGFTSKTGFKPALDQTRDELTKLHDYVVGNPVSLAAERKVTGIGVLDYVGGVLIDDRRHKQPNYIPVPAAQTTLDSLVGTYQDVHGAPNGRMLFPAGSKEAMKLDKADLFEISKQDDGSLLVVAKAGSKEIDRHVIPVKLEDGAVTFEEDDVAKGVATTAGEPTDIDTLKYYLHTDASGDLIIDREYMMEGTFPGKKTHVRLMDSYWDMLKRAPAQ